MKLSPQSLVYVYYNNGIYKKRLGRLLLKNRTFFFEYDTEFIKTGFELSPFHLPLKSGVIRSTDATFKGLFGVFNDSLPDGWGRLLLDRRLRAIGIHPENLSPLDRLCLVGSSGIGALSYEPEHSVYFNSVTEDLDAIAHEIQETLVYEKDQYLDHLIALSGSSLGARPKVLLNIENEEWLIKFRSSIDPKDIGAIEYAYHLLALEAGLDVPSARLFPAKKGPGFFGVQRFDRQFKHRFHVHTLAGLLHADHRYPSLDYETIMQTTLYLTQDIRQCEIQFRNAVFNVLSHNRDDHSKNFSYLMNTQGVWTVSPAYDLTFSTGPSGEHSTLVMGEGQKIQKEHLLHLAAIGNIKKDKALEIIQNICDVIEKWPTIAATVGVSKTQNQMIAKVTRNIVKNIQ